MRRLGDIAGMVRVAEAPQAPALVPQAGALAAVDPAAAAPGVEAQAEPAVDHLVAVVRAAAEPAAVVHLAVVRAAAEPAAAAHLAADQAAVDHLVAAEPAAVAHLVAVVQAAVAHLAAVVRAAAGRAVAMAVPAAAVAPAVMAAVVPAPAKLQSPRGGVNAPPRGQNAPTAVTLKTLFPNLPILRDYCEQVSANSALCWGASPCS